MNDVSRTAKRTDCHRPGAIVPADYSYRGSYALAGTEGGWPIPPYNMEHVVSVQHATRAAGHRIFGSPGKCGVCGARFREGDIWEHAPTGDLVHLGHDCADKYDMLADHADYNAGIEAHRRATAARIVAEENRRRRAAFLESHPGLEAVLGAADDERNHDILRDMARKLARYGELSDKQIAFAEKLRREHDERAQRPAEVNVAAPVGTRTAIRGVLVSKKVQDGAFGVSIKGTIKVTTADGVWLAWGTLPDSLLLDVQGDTRVEVGDTVELTATLEAGREAHFAFWKRPTKAKIVERGERGRAADAEREAKAAAQAAAPEEDPFAIFAAAS